MKTSKMQNSPGDIALDTNAYVAFMNGDKVVGQYLKSATSIFLPYVVMAELYYGFFRGSKPQENLTRLASFMNSPRVDLLTLTDQTMKIYGEIAAELAEKGKPTQQNDIWIAALCKQHDYSLITNDGGFQNITGLQTITF